MKHQVFEILPIELHNSFKDLLDWETKISTEEFGPAPECEKYHFHSVCNGMKPVADFQLYSEEDISDMEWDIITAGVLSYFRFEFTHKDIKGVVFSITRIENERFLNVIRWVQENQSSIPRPLRMYMYGIIFGYPEDEVLEFVKRKG